MGLPEAMINLILLDKLILMKGNAVRKRRYCREHLARYFVYTALNCVAVLQVDLILTNGF